MVIVWSTRAKVELKRLYEYISKDSYQNAIKVGQEIKKTKFKLSESGIPEDLLFHIKILSHNLSQNRLLFFL
jgi:plasmid stabilization system protein ParE